MNQLEAKFYLEYIKCVEPIDCLVLSPWMFMPLLKLGVSILPRKAKVYLVPMWNAKLLTECSD